MATSQTSLLAFLSNDADFRSWGSGVSAAIQACGLTKTTDTGQINWATVARPGTVSTAAGYEVYRFSDSLQATVPVFVKLEYGVAGALDRPSLWVTVGSASNGAGTLSGQLGTRRQVGPSASSTAGTLLPWYVSGSSSRLLVSGNLTAATNTGMTFSLERTKDGSGADTADGVFWFCISAALSGAQIQTIPATGAVPAATGNTHWAGVGVGNVSTQGANTALVPAVTAVGRMLFGINALVYATVDIAGGTPITVSLFGSSRTVMPMAGTNPGGVASGLAVSATIGSNFALLWE